MKDYCIEAARACIELAFEQFHIEKLYYAVKSENETSVKAAEQLDMILKGECIRIFDEKEIYH